MPPSFSADVFRAMEELRDIALDLGHEIADAEHLLLGLFVDDTTAASASLAILGCDPAHVSRAVRSGLQRGPDLGSSGRNVRLSKRLEKVLQYSYLEALGGGDESELRAVLLDEEKWPNQIDGVDLLLSLLRDSQDPLARLLQDNFGIDYALVRESRD